MSPEAFHRYLVSNPADCPHETFAAKLRGLDVARPDELIKQNEPAATPTGVRRSSL